MRIFQKDNNIVGVINEKYIYLIETYETWDLGASLIGEIYVSSKTPLKITNKMLSTKTKKSSKWKTRFITLKFAPESYLKQNGFYEL